MFVFFVVTNFCYELDLHCNLLFFFFLPISSIPWILKTQVHIVPLIDSETEIRHDNEAQPNIISNPVWSPEWNKCFVCFHEIECNVICTFAHLSAGILGVVFRVRDVVEGWEGWLIICRSPHPSCGGFLLVLFFPSRDSSAPSVLCPLPTPPAPRSFTAVWTSAWPIAPPRPPSPLAIRTSPSWRTSGTATWMTCWMTRPSWMTLALMLARRKARTSLEMARTPFTTGPPGSPWWEGWWGLTLRAEGWHEGLGWNHSSAEEKYPLQHCLQLYSKHPKISIQD